MRVRASSIVLSIATLAIGISVAGCGDSHNNTPATVAGPVTVVRSATPAVASGSPTSSTPRPAGSPNVAQLTVTSMAFQEGVLIPTKYTCDGAGVSPPVAWSGAPAATARFALIVDDPDAPGGTFTHWVLYNLPSNVTALAEAAPAPVQGGVQGNNGAGKPGYTGPCPPSGVHHYRFTVYALDVPVSTPSAAPATANELLSSMQGHILAQGRLTGLYQRLGQ